MLRYSRGITVFCVAYCLFLTETLHIWIDGIKTFDTYSNREMKMYLKFGINLCLA